MSNERWSGGAHLPPDLEPAPPDAVRHLSDETRAKDDTWLQVLPEPQAYPAKAELFEQNAQPREAFYLEAGLVKLVRVDPAGDELIVSLRYAGSWLGAASVIRAVPHATRAVALGPCRLRRLSARQFTGLLATTPAFARALEEALSEELLDQTERLAQLGSLSSRQRFEKALMQLFAAASGNGRDRSGAIWFELPLKRWEMASLIAVSPKHLSRVLRQLQNEGVIRLHKGWIIARHDELRRASDS